MPNANALPRITNMGALAGRRVLVRASLNVPVRDGKVMNDFRLRAIVPQLKELTAAGARVVLIGHIGRDPARTLEPVARCLREHIPMTFVPDLLGARAARAVEDMADGEIVLLENVRSEDGEVENDAAFAQKLVAYGDIYINEAFAVSHRAHASMVCVPRFMPHYAGVQLIEEVGHLNHALNPDAPSLFILGGAKFETKVPLIKKFLDRYTTVFVGGAVVHDIFRAKGMNIGRSLTSGEYHRCKDLINHPNLVLPVDVTVRTKSGETILKTPDAVADEDMILDTGPKTVALLKERIMRSRTILWNGPLGDYEKGFFKQTEEVAKLVAACAGTSVVGGGDTIASIAKLDLEERFTFVSTGGGAMLEYLKAGTLPAIDVLLE